MLKAILIDDESSSLNSLREKILRHCPEVTIIAACESAQEGITAIDSLHPDVVFLDIEMPVMNGFLMLQQLQFKNFELIFTTAYDHYAIKAIRFSALDYLMKPIEIEELKSAVRKAGEEKEHSSSGHQLEVLLENVLPKKNAVQRLAIPTAEGLQFIKLQDIIYLEANVNYTYFHLAGHLKYVVSRTLKDFEEMLPAEIFVRIHNSYIINKDYAEKYIRGEGGQVVLSNGIVLDVAKRKKADFLKAIGYILLFLTTLPSLAQTPRFIKHVLTTDFISEGVAIADVNKDGKPDILAGAFWFEAPGWTRHEIATPVHYDPKTQFSNSFLDFSLDVNQDGWIDMIRISLPGEEAVWYENPGTRSGHWPMHPILKNCGNESPAFVDMDGDGRPDILCNDPVAKEMIWMRSPSVKGDTLWVRHIIAQGDVPGVNRYTHGLGLTDMNGDGRSDVVITKGWWEAPADPAKENWTFQPAELGEDCSQIYALDVKGNGHKDLISASAHRYGIWWHEQTDTGWIHHVIFDKFSESHALAMADINGDGHPDLVSGKRYFAHNGGDPGAYEPSVLYWLEFHPGAVPLWIPHLIDSASGVGLQVLVQDIDGNGAPDIIVANKNGVFLFTARASGKK